MAIDELERGVDIRFRGGVATISDDLVDCVIASKHNPSGDLHGFPSPTEQCAKCAKDISYGCDFQSRDGEFLGWSCDNIESEPNHLRGSDDPRNASVSQGDRRKGLDVLHRPCKAVGLVFVINFALCDLRIVNVFLFHQIM